MSAPFDELDAIDSLISSATSTPNEEAAAIYLAMARCIHTRARTRIDGVGRLLDAHEHEIVRASAARSK